MKKISRKTWCIGTLIVVGAILTLINLNVVRTQAGSLGATIWTKQPQLNNCGICETLRAPTSIAFQLLVDEQTSADYDNPTPTTFWWSCDGDDTYEGGPTTVSNFISFSNDLYSGGQKVVWLSNTYDQQFKLLGNKGWSYGSSSYEETIGGWSEYSQNYNPHRWSGTNISCGYNTGGTHTIKMKAERNGVQTTASRTFSLANQASKFVPGIGFPESRYLQYGMDLRNYETENGSGYKPSGMATPAKVHLALNMKRTTGQPLPGYNYSVPGSDSIEPFTYRIECGNGQIKTGSKWQWGEDAPIYQGSILSRAVLATNACQYEKAGEYSLSVYFTDAEGINVDHDGNGTPLKTQTNVKVSAGGPAKIILDPNPGQTKTGGTVYFNTEVSNLTPFGSGPYSIKVTCDSINKPNVTQTEEGNRNEYKDTNGILTRSIGGCTYAQPGFYRAKVEFTGTPHSEQWMGIEKGEATADVYVTGKPEPVSVSEVQTGPNEKTITRNYYFPGGPILFYLDWLTSSSDEDQACVAKDFQRVTQREYPEGYNELGKWTGELNEANEFLNTFEKELKNQLTTLSGKSKSIELKPGLYEYWLKCEGNENTTTQIDRITVGGRYWSAVVVGVNSTQTTNVLVDGGIVHSFNQSEVSEAYNNDPRLKGIATAKEHMPSFDPAIRENISYAEMDDLIEYMNNQYGGGD